MVLYWYFKRVEPASVMPSLNGPLSAKLSPATIKDANDKVAKCFDKQSAEKHTYNKIPGGQQAKIIECATQHGNAAAVHQFSKELGVSIAESSVCVWRAKYLDIMRRRREAGETGVVSVKELPAKKRGRPLLLGRQDGEVKSYIGALREGGEVVTTSIIMAAATAIVRRHD